MASALSTLTNKYPDLEAIIRDVISGDKYQAIALCVSGNDLRIAVRIPKTPDDKDAVREDWRTVKGGMRIIGSQKEASDMDLAFAWMVRNIRRVMPPTISDKVTDYTWDHGYLFMETIPPYPSGNKPNVFIVMLDHGPRLVPMFVA